MTERSDADLDELAEKLFEAGRGEPVPPGARARALEALGLPAQAPPAAPGGGPLPTLLKWGGLGALAVGVGTAVLLARQPPETEPAEPPKATPTEVAQAPLTPPPEISAPPEAAEAAPAAPSAQPLASGMRRPAAPAASPASSAPGGDALGEELRALDRARSALRGGDPQGALTQLAEYDRAYPRGALRSEALLLRVEALVRSGRRAEAERLAAPILARDPDGLAARRLKGLLE